MEFHDLHRNIYQTGDGFDLPIYRGVKTVQRGQGIGTLLSKLFKFALPVVKKHVLPQVTRGVISSIGQVAAEPKLNRKTLKEIFQRNSKEAGREILLSGLNYNKKKKRKQKGKGKQKKRVKKGKIVILKRKVKQTRKGVKDNKRLRNYIDKLVRQ